MKQWIYDVLGMCSIIVLAITYLLQIWILSLCEIGVGKLIGMEDTSVSLGPYIQSFFLLYGLLPLCLLVFSPS